MAHIQRYAPDTNFFFHAKSPEQLPWRELTDADEVELVVLDEVMRELDRHKANGNSRSARRAREVFAKLDPLIDDEVEEILVRECGPRVVWRLAPFLDPGRTKPGVLDLSTSDGRIVEEAFALHQMIGNLAFLSNDRLPRRMAKAVGLTSLKIADDWLLEPETDNRDKEIAKLKEELKTWERRSPQIDIQLVKDEKAIERIEGSVWRHGPLSDQFIGEALQSIQLRYPEESSAIPGQITVTSERAIAAYQLARREWLARVRDYLERQPARLNFDKGLLELTLAISNSGGAPAEGLSIEVWVEGAMMLVNDAVRAKFFTSGPRISLPKPPKFERLSAFDMPRQPNFSDSLSRMHDMIKMPSAARDSQGFYWDYENRDGLMCKSAEGTCEDFRHQVRDVELPIILCLPQDEHEEPNGCLHVRWSARNLPKAIEKKYPIRLTFDWLDSEDVIGRLLIEDSL